MDTKIKGVLRYITVFSFDDDDPDAYKRICDHLAAGSAWTPSKAWSKEVEQDLYNYIIDQFSHRDDATNIASSWQYNELDSLPALIYKPQYPNESDKEYDIQFEGMGLFIFRSRIGIFWHEVRDPGFDNIEELIRFQNIFKEYNPREERQKVFLRDKPGEYYAFGETIDRIIREIDDDIFYFAQRKSRAASDDAQEKKRPIPDKALLFSHTAIPADSEDISDHDSELIKYTAFLCNGYTSNHRIPDDLETQMYHPQSNIYWYLTREGSACCAKYDPQGNDFLATRFLNRFKNDYFLIYIILLHQSYSLLSMSTWIEKNLPATVTEYIESEEENRMRLEKLMLRMNTFLSKNIYASVSHIQYQDGYYSYGVDRLQIHKDIESISLGTGAVNEILQVQENRREASNDSQRNIIFGLLSILIIFSALTDADSLFDVPFDVRFRNPVYWIVMIVIFAVVGITIFQLLRLRSSKNKRK